MAKRFEDTEKYKKGFIRNLPGAYKLLWDYICLECDHAGIWEVDFEVAQIYLGRDMAVKKDLALGYFNTGDERIIVLNGGSKWFIRPFIEFQYGALSPLNRMHNSVLHILSKYEIKGLISPLQGAKDKDKVKDKDNPESIKIIKKPEDQPRPPTLSEVQEYCKTAGVPVDATRFWAHYQATGWKIGDSPIKDWKALLIKWSTPQDKEPVAKATVAPRASKMAYEAPFVPLEEDPRGWEPLK